MKIKKRRSIATCTCLMMTLCLFNYIHRFAHQPAITNHFTTSPEIVQWNNIKAESQDSEPRVREIITCNRSHIRYDLCEINGPTLLDPRSSTLYGPVSHPATWQRIKPYPRKPDKTAMARVQELTVSSGPPRPGLKCHVTHDAPALVFSAGGYTGNFFHDFNEGLVPLFITVESMFPDRHVVFAVVDFRSWWARKYREPLTWLTRHPIVDLGKESSTHCFPSAVIGLVTHGLMTINPGLLLRPKRLVDFQAFLKTAFGFVGKNVSKRENATPHCCETRNASTFNIIRNNYKLPENNGGKTMKPRMVFVSRHRRHGRAVLNQRELIKLAQGIGFDVTILDPTAVTSLGDSFRLLQTSHAMMGVHGAGLTHEIFLKPGAVLVQIVPIGTEGVAISCYENPGRALGLDYLEYKIEARESTLVEAYENSSLVIRDPNSVVNGNWTNMRLYLKKQNVRLDIVRFSEVLRKAYDKAKRFMERGG